MDNKLIENYNNQFTKYIESESSYWGTSRYISDMEGLINTVIDNNNKNKRKITIISGNTKYTSVDELKQLLNEINTKLKYEVVNGYDNNYEYIESMTISPYCNRYVKEFLQYVGKQQRGSLVKQLIQNVQAKVVNHEEIKIIITYISNTNQKTIINVNDNDLDEISNLMKEISSAKIYDVEIQNDLEVCNIIITSNN